MPVSGERLGNAVKAHEEWLQHEKDKPALIFQNSELVQYLNKALAKLMHKYFLISAIEENDKVEVKVVLRKGMNYLSQDLQKIAERYLKEKNYLNK